MKNKIRKYKERGKISKTKVKELIRDYGKLYSDELNINLNSQDEEEIFKWFIASVLFGAPITEKNAKKTFLLLENYKIDTPDRILKAGWNRLVEVLDEGGYTRYDFKTADKLLELSKNIKKEGSLTNIYKSSKDNAELKSRLMNLAKGIGDTTVNIFLRDMQGIWDVEPEHTKAVLDIAKKLNIKLDKFDKYLDTALIRYMHNANRKQKRNKQKKQNKK